MSRLYTVPSLLATWVPTKPLEKIRERFYWPGFEEDVKRRIQQCEQCQKRSNPPKTHRHSLVNWKPSYPFHHVSLDFLGPLPNSQGNRYILLIGDHFTKWYEAIPLPNWTAYTTANALLEHWICRFGCPESIHTDRGTNFDSELFRVLMQKLEINKTRTTAFHPQSNAVCERMNRTLLNMLAKCIDEDQTNWSQQLPYVLMAYRASVHESTGYTPHFLVFGTETTLPLDLMYPPPPPEKHESINKFVLDRQQAFHNAYELARRNSTTQQLRRNRLYNRKVHGPTYQPGEHVLLHYPVVKTGRSPKLSSPWRGPYRIIACLNDVNYHIEEISTSKRQVVHYDRIKRYHGPIPAASNVPNRNVTTSAATPTQSHSLPSHDDCCTSSLPSFVHVPPQTSTKLSPLPPRSFVFTSSPTSDEFPNRPSQCTESSPQPDITPLQAGSPNLSHTCPTGDELIHPTITSFPPPRSSSSPRQQQRNSSSSHVSPRRASLEPNQSTSSQPCRKPLGNITQPCGKPPLFSNNPQSQTLRKTTLKFPHPESCPLRDSLPKEFTDFPTPPLESLIDRAAQTLQRSNLAQPENSSSARGQTMPTGPSSNNSQTHQKIRTENQRNTNSRGVSTSPPVRTRTLRASTRAQRGAQPLFKAKLPSVFTDFVSPSVTQRKGATKK